MRHQIRPVPKTLVARVENELQASERILWMEIPIPRYFTQTSKSMFFFGLPWTAFSVFWTVGASQGSILFGAFGIPFILIGILLLTSPLREFKKSTRTVYAITDRRALKIEVGKQTLIRSFYPDQLKDMYRKEYRDGSGDVIFTRENSNVTSEQGYWVDVGFLSIADPKQVESELRKLIEEYEKIADVKLQKSSRGRTDDDS